MEDTILRDILFFLMIVSSIISLVVLVFVKIPNDAKKYLLEDMFKNNDISSETYKKYNK